MEQQEILVELTIEQQFEMQVIQDQLPNLSRKDLEELLIAAVAQQYAYRNILTDIYKAESKERALQFLRRDQKA